jgi:undecaprenyl diphosphate synthase
MKKTFDFHPSHGSVPTHVGIIPDGGRRWAHAHGCTLEEAYKKTRSILEAMVGLLLEKGVRVISIYLSSIQNFRREPADLAVYVKLIESAFSNEITDIANLNDLKVVIAGNRLIIPSSLLSVVIAMEQSTSQNSRGQLNLLLAYDPLEEILDAVKKSDNPEYFYNHLWINTPVDIVIRTGNAQLLSNFLPLQSGYARLFFFDKLFNDFTTADLTKVLENFAKIERKFGE